MGWIFRLAGLLLKAISRGVGLAYFTVWKLSGQVIAGRGVKVAGKPMIDLWAGTRLVIGEGVTLNSLNRGYHLNMFGPVKLIADKPGACIVIGDETRVHGACIHARERIDIGKRCLIAANCQIMDSSGHNMSAADPAARITTQGSIAPVVIEDDVWLAAGVTVLPGSRIGRGSVIATGSVVSGDIPPMSVAGGIPCRVLRPLGSTA